MVELKSPSEIEIMREAGRVVAAALAATSAAAHEGVTLSALDDLAAEVIASHGAKPSFLGYHPSWAPTPFPGVVCLSVNNAIVHGIPDATKLRHGDILSIDCGASVDGYHGDAALTVAIGQTDAAGERLMETTRLALAAGIAQARPGNRIGDISHAIETVARQAGYGLAFGMGGHGIGTQMHQDPDVPNTGRPNRGFVLREGLVLALEPMLTEGGSDRNRTAQDGWTILTADGKRAAHFEHTVAITSEGPLILTS